MRVKRDELEWHEYALIILALLICYVGWHIYYPLWLALIPLFAFSSSLNKGKHDAELRSQHEELIDEIRKLKEKA